MRPCFARLVSAAIGLVSSALGLGCGGAPADESIGGDLAPDTSVPDVKHHDAGVSNRDAGASDGGKPADAGSTADAGASHDAAGGLDGGPTASDGGLGWTTVSTPPVNVLPCNMQTQICPSNYGDILNGVAALAPTDAWAVGTAPIAGQLVGNTTAPLALHWDGSTWTGGAIPTPAGASTASLSSVSGAAADDVWAVGESSTATCNNMWSICVSGLIEHWNGTAWSIVTTPAVGFTQELVGVYALASNDVWAVGDAWVVNTANPYSLPLVLHYDGTSWTQIAQPFTQTAVLNSVYGSASNDVWVVGDGVNTPIALHWNGTAFAQVAFPSAVSAQQQDNIFLGSVSGTASNDVWIAGNISMPGAGEDDVTAGKLWHWDGRVWSLIDSPSTDGLNGVAAIASNDASAVGAGNPEIEPYGTALLHWNGTSWSLLAPPLDGVSLFAVASDGANDVWAVGEGATYPTLSYTAHY